jgi:hypothetical protein
MSENGMLTYEQALAAARNLTATIRHLEDELEQAMAIAADAEAAYRGALGTRYRHHREQGVSTASEVEALSRADVVVLSRDRDHAEARVRHILQRLEDRTAERHSLHRLMDWSMPSRSS